ncbi:hypothetical protein [Halonotius sp. GCM10025705]|uniref:COG1470 family protein n=1 Tax=Halonotius sp. GCM10025705 TaxID=3252678 RepID=UPI00361E1068
MNSRTLMLITLVVVGAVAATGVVAATTGSTATATETATASDGVTAPDPGNYTRLYVDEGYRNLELKPGESDTVTVSIENGEDEAVDIAPRIATPPTRSQPPVEPDWVSIPNGETTLDAGESTEVEISVDVPDDAEIGDYRGVIAFTDETVRYPGRPPQPIHSVSLSVDVWQEPTVQLNSETHIYTHLQAGETITREISVSNTGEEAVPVNPQFNAENRRRHRPGGRTTLDRSWVTIEAPSEVAPGETETIELTVEPPLTPSAATTARPSTSALPIRLATPTTPTGRRSISTSRYGLPPRNHSRRASASARRRVMQRWNSPPTNGAEPASAAKTRRSM